MDKIKQEQAKKKDEPSKPVYVSPTAMRLDDLHAGTGSGFCQPGSGARGWCTSGGGANHHG